MASRRQFLKTSGLAALGAYMGLKTLTHGSTANAQGKLPLVKEDEPMAKALKYVADAKKADKAARIDRAGVAGNKQFCWNCDFYKVEGDPKKAPEGPCTLFPGKAVKGEGWCNSWVQNKKLKI